MDRHGLYVATLVVGVLLVGHAFLYEGRLMAAGLVSFLDPVGAISPMPYGAYHVGTGVAYATAAVIGLCGSRRVPSLREVGLVIGGGVIASWICVYGFWTNAGMLLSGWGWGFVFAPAQIVLFPVLGLRARITREAGAPPSVFNVPLHHLFAVGSGVVLLPVLAYAGAGIVAGGWSLLNVVAVAVLVVLNIVFGYPLYRLGRGMSGWDNDHAGSNHPSRS